MPFAHSDFFGEDEGSDFDVLAESDGLLLGLESDEPEGAVEADSLVGLRT